MKQFISNTAQVKNNNVQIVKNALKALESGTKTTIAHITGLSVATCNTILNELAVSGEILELENEYSSVGRPAKAYRFNENYSYVCCIYMSYENQNKILKYAVVNLVGNIISEQSNIKEHIDYIVIQDTVQELLEKYNNIQVIGIGIPGVANHENIIDICDIEELVGCPLVERLYEKFGKKVIVENDMNLIAYGFFQAGEYAEDASIAVIAFFKDNWPGSGIIVDGHIIRGKTNFAGEVSFLPFGYTREEQKELLKNKKGIIDVVTKTICSLTAIINPEAIIMTGTLLSEDIIEEVSNLSKEIIPSLHMPKVTLDNNFYKYYLNGISSMTLEYISNLNNKAHR